MVCNAMQCKDPLGLVRSDLGCEARSLACGGRRSRRGKGDDEGQFQNAQGGSKTAREAPKRSQGSLLDGRLVAGPLLVGGPLVAPRGPG